MKKNSRTVPPAALRGASRRVRGRLPLDPRYARLWVNCDVMVILSHCMLANLGVDDKKMEVEPDGRDNLYRFIRLLVLFPVRREGGNIKEIT